jgi:hypothetical protein
MVFVSPLASSSRISLLLLLLLGLAAGAHAQGNIGLCSDYGGNLCQGRCGPGWSCSTPYGGTQTFSCQPCACTPATCQAGECGTKSDGCGGTLDCGACCTPATCQAGECGSKPNGCGGTLNCGACSCTPATCQAGECGTRSNGCGGTLNCGACPSCGDATCQEHCSVCPLDCGTCDGSGGSLGPCSALTNPCQGRCGPWTCDAGGGQTATITCPACPCTPLTCQPGDCGTKANGCGGTIDCGCCPKTCGTGDCGSKADGCGGTLDCGACPYCGDAACQEHCTVCPQDCGTCDGSGGSLGPCGALTNPCQGRCGPWTCDAGGGQTGTINCPACPCTPLTCQADDCGSKNAGCGTTIECGGCPDGSFCSGNRCVEYPPPCGQGGPCSTCESECSQSSATCRTYCMLQPPSPYPAPVLATCQAYASLYPEKPNSCLTCLPDSVCSMAPQQASLSCAIHGGVLETTCNDERNSEASYVCKDGFHCTLTCDALTHEVSPDPACGFLCTGGSTAVCQASETCETCPQDCGRCPVGDDELSVLSYNVQFLPFDWAEGNSNPQRAGLIGRSPILKNYDVIVFEEAFDDRARDILGDVLAPEYPYQTSVLDGDHWGPQFTNGGVFIVSRWPFVPISTAPNHLRESLDFVYTACSGWGFHGPLDDPDCLSNKGVKYARVDKLGRIHHIYGTHTDAGNDSGDTGARWVQMIQMRSFINSSHPALPRNPADAVEIMAGDFNIKRDGPEYSHMLSSLRASAPLAIGTGTNLDGDWIDYVLHENSTWLQPTSSSNEVLSAMDRACPGSYEPCNNLSDHHPLLGRFTFRAASNGAAAAARAGVASLGASLAQKPLDCRVTPAIEAPEPLGPTGPVTSDVQRFSWAAVAGAEQYRLQVTDAETSGSVLDVTIRETSFTPDPIVAPGKWYRWSVRALRGNEQGPPCEDQLFGFEETPIGAPVPLSPSGPVQGEYPTFAWSAVPAATRYEVEVVDALTGESVLSGLVPPTPTVQAWKGLDVDRAYRWTVTALRGTKRGPKSAPEEFSVAAASGLSSPESVGPMGPVEGGLPTFSWNAVSGADSYRLTIATGTQVVETAVAGTSYVPPSALPTGSYRWEVRAVRNEMTGPPSVTMFFRTLASNRPPTVSITSCGECTAPCALLLAAQATEPDGDELRYSWSGCASGDLTTATCVLDQPGPATATVTVSDGRGGTATASVTLQGAASLSVTKDGDGTGTVRSAPPGIECGTQCNSAYAFGTNVTLTPVPGAGSTFAGWSGACTGTGPCTLTMDGAKAVTARFGAPVIHVVSPNGGEILPSGSIQTIGWTSSKLDPGARIRLSCGNGRLTYPIASGLEPATGSYQWTVPPASGAGWKVTVCSEVGGTCEVQDSSDGFFTILTRRRIGVGP